MATKPKKPARKRAAKPASKPSVGKLEVYRGSPPVAAPPAGRLEANQAELARRITSAELYAQEERSTGFDSKLAMAAAANARAIASLLGEQRQLAKDEIRTLTEFSDDAHAEYWKTRDIEEFERFTNKVKGIERTGKLL